MWCYVSREAWDSAQISGCNHLHRHQFPPGLPWNQILSFSHLLFFFMYLCICVLKSYKDLSSVLVESYTPLVHISPINSLSEFLGVTWWLQYCVLWYTKVRMTTEQCSVIHQLTSYQVWTAASEKVIFVHPSWVINLHLSYLIYCPSSS